MVRLMGLCSMFGGGDARNETWPHLAPFRQTRDARSGGTKVVYGSKMECNKAEL